MRPFLLILCLATLLAPSPVQAETRETVLWVSIGTGLTWFNNVDPDQLEDLATALSIRPTNPTSSRKIAFDKKGFEVPVQIQLGARLNSNVNIWGMYQRLPYVLDGPIPGPESGGTLLNPPDDTIRLRLPANVFGGGMDFRLGRADSDSYSSAMMLSLGIGLVDVQGNDEDVLTIHNFEVGGRGLLYEARLLFEVDFSSDLKFYPFVAFRYSKITDTEARFARSPTVEPAVPDFNIEYTGVTLGVSVRFKVWPFENTDDEPSIFDE